MATPPLHLVSVTAIPGDQMVIVAWGPNDTDATKYRVYRQKPNGAYGFYWAHEQNRTGGGTHYFIDGARTNGTEYTYRVIPVGADGTTPTHADALEVSATPGGKAGHYVYKTNAGTVSDAQTQWAAWETFTSEPLTGVKLHVLRGSWTAYENPWWLTVPRKVTLNWMPYPDGVGGTLAQVVAGTHDTHYRTLAQRLIANGKGDAIVCLMHEFNGDWYPWSAVTAGAATFINAYRHMVDVLRSVSGAQFKFAWIVAFSDVSHTILDPEDCYPGDSYVDYVGFDIYDNDPEYIPSQGGAWATNRRAKFEDRGRIGDVSTPRGLEWMTAFRASHNKKLIVPEFGLTTIASKPTAAGGDNPEFIDMMADWIAANPTILHAYHESSPSDGDHWIETNNFPNAKADFLTKFFDAEEVDTTPPMQLTQVTATAGDGQVTLTWTPNDTSATFYRIWRRIKTGSWSYGWMATKIRGGTGTHTFVDGNVNNGITYQYKVLPVDQAANMANWSTALIREATPAGAPTGVPVWPAYTVPLAGVTFINPRTLTETNTGIRGYYAEDLGRNLTYNDLTEGGFFTSQFAGQVIERKNLSGVRIVHANVTVRACRIRHASGYGISKSNDALAGTRIEWCDITGTPPHDGLGVLAGNIFMYRCNISGTRGGGQYRSGTQAAPTTIQECYVDELFVYDGSHNTCASTHGAEYILVISNSFNDGTSSAWSNYANVAPNNYITLQNNYLNVRGTTYYQVQGGYDKPYAAQSDNIRYINNIMGIRCLAYPTAWLTNFASAPGNVVAGNVWENGNQA